MTPAQTLATIRNQVYETTAAFYSDAEIYSYMWQAEQEIAETVKCVEVRDTTSLTSATNTEYYSLPNTVSYVHRLEFDGVKLKKIDYRSRDAMEYPHYGSTLQTGNPYFYYQWGSQVGIYPVPQNIKNMTLYYYGTPAEISTASTAFSVPALFHRYIPDYCLYRMYAKDQDEGRANFHRQQWEANIIRGKQNWAQRMYEDEILVVKSDDFYPETELGMI